MVQNRRVLALLAVALLVVTAGCSGAGNAGGADGGESTGLARSGDGGDAAYEQAAATAQPEAERKQESLQVRREAIIRTGRVSMEVGDYGAAQANLTAAVQRQGGFVSDSSREVDRVNNETYVTGQLTLRVPSENFSAMMSRIESEGTVEASRTSTQDVTDQLVDLEARLNNLRAQRDQLRSLYRQANDTEDVLAVQERLAEVQTEIERLEAQKQSLERRVAYSTITVDMREPRPDRRVAPAAWYDTPVLTAFLQSVDGVVVALRALVVAFAYALPYLLVFLGPLVLLVLAVLYRRRLLPGTGG
jgi:hypothetical protein